MRNSNNTEAWKPPDGCFNEWIRCVSWKDGATHHDSGVAFLVSCTGPNIAKDSVDRLMRTPVVDGMPRSFQQDYEVDFGISEEVGSSDEVAKERLK